jgi:hypothetical protein
MAGPRAAQDALLKDFRPYAWLAALVFVLYARCLNFGLIYLDDNIFLQKQFDFLADWRNFSVLFRKDAFIGTSGHFYRPLLISTFMVDAHLWGGAVGLWHASNIVFHAASCALVFRILSRFCKRAPAFLLAAAFAAHPALSSAMAWVCGRTDTVFALWALGSFHCFQLFLESGKPRWALAHLALLAGAFLTKELAIVVSLACLSYSVLVDNRPTPAFWRRLILAGWAAELGAWGVIRKIVLHPQSDYSVPGGARSVLAGLPALLVYWGKTLLPLNLSPYPILPDSPYAWGAAAVVIAALAFLRIKPTQRPTALWGLLWFVLFLAPSFVYPDKHIQPVLYEYRLYLPLLGALVFFSRVDFIAEFDLRRGSRAAAAGLLLSALAALSWTNESSYRDAFSAWRRAAVYSPDSAVVHSQLGLAYVMEKDYSHAEAEYSNCIALEPEMRGAHSNLGAVYMNEGRWEDAREQFHLDLEANPGDYDTLRNLGLALRALREKSSQKK